MADSQSVRDIHAHIQVKAASDTAFREQLQKAPRATIEREVSRILGRDFALPEGTEVVVVTDTPAKIHVVIPPDLSAERELSEAELDAVAGGDSNTWSFKRQFCSAYEC